ncbi:hypothetical protein FOL47_004296, partial [Perkinsus chesapeaki]
DGYGSCIHHQIGPVRSITAYCDASNTGWGYLIYAEEMNHSVDQKDFPSREHLLEAHAGEWDDKHQNYHVNRKEAITLHRTLKAVLDWLPRFTIDERQHITVKVYNGNSSAVSWASSGMVNMKSYDKIALQRLSEAMKDIRDMSQKEYGIPIDVDYIPGLRNSMADELSRVPIRADSLPPLQESEGLKEKRKSKVKKSQRVVVLVASPSGSLSIVDDISSSHRGALNFKCPDPNEIYKASLIQEVWVAEAKPDEYDNLLGIADETEEE